MERGTRDGKHCKDGVALLKTLSVLSLLSVLTIIRFWCVHTHACVVHLPVEARGYMDVGLYHSVLFFETESPTESRA